MTDDALEFGTYGIWQETCFWPRWMAETYEVCR